METDYLEFLGSIRLLQVSIDQSVAGIDQSENLGSSISESVAGMDRSNMKVVAFCVWVAVVAEVIAGQSVADQYLNAHNSARQAVGAGIPNLAWSNDLQSYATNWANRQASTANCALTHSGGPYGENIFWSSGASTPANAVTAWVNERQYYNYASNSCAANQVCGHYTQVVWRNSQFLGCGSARCPAGGTFVVCSYNPPGNFNGQRPYLTREVEGSHAEA